ncbi:MAG: hypothetical protein J3K34DRAFT_491132 [Monoraphidium minutum]|nr:MAG: hypothetical protein J3K34DRAFT_491132 [Monoraphidium minutum]
MALQPPEPAAAPRRAPPPAPRRGAGVKYAAAAPAAGETLVLSAGTLRYDGSHPTGPAISTPAACRGACAAAPGCGGWAFCGAAGGCGGGCKAYARAHPKLPPPGPTADVANMSFPIPAFGPWTFPHSSSDGCAPLALTGGATADAWPFGMCSLKRPAGGAAAASTAAAAAAAGGPAPPNTTGQGWEYGTIEVPEPECAGLSAAACAACLAAARPAECLACAADARAALPAGSDYVVRRGSDAQRGCAVCANVTAAAERKLCFGCILDSQPCATCALGGAMWGPGPPDVAACLSCAAKRGQALSGECNECAQSLAPGRCFACLAAGDASVKRCKTGAEALGSCRQPGAPTPCARCANAAAGGGGGGAFDRCVACFADPQRDNECAACALLPQADGGGGAQARCFQCVARAGFASYQHSGCSECFAPGVDGAARGACLECAEAKATAPGAKALCAACAGGGGGGGGGGAGGGQAKARKACVACLQSGKGDPAKTCLGARPRRRGLLSLLDPWGGGGSLFARPAA